VARFDRQDVSSISSQRLTRVTRDLRLLA